MSGAESTRCPGCGCEEGDGRTPGCAHPDGCGYFSTALPPVPEVEPDFPPGPVEPVGPETQTSHGTTMQLYRCELDSLIWICETDGVRRTWRLVTRIKPAERAAGRALRRLLPFDGQCVICANEGGHEADRPHVYEGQE